MAPCQAQEEPEKDRITKEDGGGTEHVFVLAVVDHATRAFAMMALVGEGGARTGGGGGGGTSAGEKERRQGEGGASPLIKEH